MDVGQCPVHFCALSSVLLTAQTRILKPLTLHTITQIGSYINQPLGVSEATQPRPLKKFKASQGLCSYNEEESSGVVRGVFKDKKPQNFLMFEKSTFCL